MGKGARAWIYLGPICLAVLEVIVRTLLKVNETTEFIGPTIAAAAIAMVLPLTVLRTLKSKGDGYAQVQNAEVTFVFWLSFVIVIMGILWALDLCLALKPDSLPFVSNFLNRAHIGTICLWVVVYLLGIALTEFRESRGWE